MFRVSKILTANYSGRLICLLLFASSGSIGGAAAPSLTFEQHVRPILKAKCFHCHGEEEDLKGELDLRLVRLMTVGGESGAAVVPSDVEASLLWTKIESDEMPEGPKKLSSSEKDIIRNWIVQGAKTARPEPQNVDDAKYTFEELSHWAFQPVTRPTIPDVNDPKLRNAIDKFVASKLAAHQVGLSSEADKHTLIRRATFDLTGLPPTTSEVDAFLSDDSEDAYERLIDRLLASPQFGVRWGRHWLDVAGYADSDGGQNGDPKRPYAWHYRDYVVNAFNSNKPIDQFLREQLAGDEMLVGPADESNDRHVELLAATGFLRMAPDATQNSNTLADRNMAVSDALRVVSSAMLGVTIGCAQCHNHKYDPIAIDDYYRFRAIFDPAFPLEQWQTPNARLVDLTEPHIEAEQKRIEQEAQKLEKDLNRRRNEVAKRIQNEKLETVPMPLRQLARDAVTSGKTATDQQRKILDQYPMVKPIGTILGLLVEYDSASYRKFEKEKEKIAALRATKPASRKIMVVQERPDVVPTSKVFFRGNPEFAKGEVEPAELFVLAMNGKTPQIPTNDQQLASTGRRLAYANYLTSGSHPLTARVFVNRIWMHHMHRGIVATPADFGLSGALPSHPRLLDWLADDFVTHGWDQKRLHRMIMLSATYRQSSKRRAELEQVDPENRLFGRMNMRRLEAEVVRDAIFAVSDELSRSLGGASVPVTQNLEGKVVIGEQKIKDGLKAGVQGGAAYGHRRSIFLEVRRSLPLNIMATFDQPTMNPNCDLRSHSTVATQSLWFMNDGFVVRRASEIARSIHSSVPADSNVATAGQINELFLRLFAKPPTRDERQLCLDFLERQTEHFQHVGNSSTKTGRNASHIQALSALCQTLLASNRFLYVD